MTKVEALVEPGDGEDQHQTGQHEAEAGKQAAEPATAHHPEMDAKLVRFRPGQHLVDGKQSVEALCAQPFLLVDQFPPDHGDLRHRPASGEKAEAQEAREDGEEGRRRLWHQARRQR